MAALVDLYVCSMCGITSETYKNWGPVCPKSDSRVCDRCCYECEYHAGCGDWMCRYITPERKRAESMKRIRDRFNTENDKISEAYHRKRKEEIKLYYIKKAKSANKAARNPGGR